MICGKLQKDWVKSGNLHFFLKSLINSDFFFISPIHYYFFSTVQWRHEARGTILNILDKEHFRRGRKFYWMAVLKEGNFALKSTVNWNSGSE